MSVLDPSFVRRLEAAVSAVAAAAPPGTVRVEVYGDLLAGSRLASHYPAHPSFRSDLVVAGQRVVVQFNSVVPVEVVGVRAEVPYLRDRLSASLFVADVAGLSDAEHDVCVRLLLDGASAGRARRLAQGVLA